MKKNPKSLYAFIQAFVVRLIYMIISKKNNIIIGISTKKDGQMMVREGNEGFFNRNKYFSEMGVDVSNLVSAKIVHGDNIETVSFADRGKVIENTDGLITQDKGVCLSVTVSDCLPVFIYNKNTIGILHAGWKSITKNILVKAIEKMNKQFNCSRENLNVFIGPHIKKCHFEVKSDVLKKFAGYNGQILKKDGNTFIELEGVVKKQIFSLGLKEKNVRISLTCTYCDENYFSFRREKPEEVTSQIAHISFI